MSMTAWSVDVPFDPRASSLSQSWSIASATIVFSTVFGSESDMLDPSARNSNLLPVKANGLVRLRSPPCIGSGGSTGVPRPRKEPGVCGSPSPDSIASNTFPSSAPRKIEMIAGGGAHGPVVVLARAVHARERLLVQQAHEAVAAGHRLHQLHRQLLVVRAH